MKKVKAEVLENKKINEDYFVMDMYSEDIASSAQPGQFIHIRIQGETGQTFLRRPFSIHSLKKGDIFQIMYKVVGAGTKTLSHCPPGIKLDIIGPLGRGFYLDPEKNNLLAAGGIGIAPLFFLAQSIKNYHAENKSLVFIGAKCADGLLKVKEFEEMGFKVLTSTDDGSCGKSGLVTQLLADFIKEKENVSFKNKGEIFGCGPAEMLRSLIKLSKDLNIECQVSLEEMFACGIGACLGCAVAAGRGGGYKMVCKDGPVFFSDEIII